VHKFAPRGPGELSPEEELSLHHYVSKKMPDRLHVAKLIAGYEVCLAADMDLMKDNRDSTMSLFMVAAMSIASFCCTQKKNMLG
jgi:hypothetical protein